MQFVSVDAAGHLSVTKEARKLLGETLRDTSLTTVAVIGPYRSGKSSLLNAICGASPFPTSANVQAQTHGLWFSRFVNQGNNANFLFIDTEGLNSPDSNIQHDIDIFTMAILFSSKVCFNSMGALSSTNLADLQCAGKVAEILRSHAKIEASMPQLFWILRDFSLNLVDDQGEPTTATLYIESALDKLQPELALSIRSLFSVRSAITLPRPCTKEGDLTLLRNVVPGFTSGIEQVKREIFSTKQKVIGSVPITGCMLLGMAECFCKMMSEGNIVPKMDTIWNTLCTINSNQAYLSCMTQVQKALSICAPDKNLFLQEPILHLPQQVIRAFSKALLEPPPEHMIEQMCIALSKCQELVQQSEQTNLDQWKKQLSFEHGISELLEFLKTSGSFADERSAYLFQTTLMGFLNRLATMEAKLQEAQEENRQLQDDKERLQKDRLQEEALAKAFTSNADALVQEKTELELKLCQLQSEQSHFQQTYNESEKDWEALQKQTQESLVTLANKITDLTRTKEMLERQNSEHVKKHETDERMINSLKRQLDEEAETNHRTDSKHQHELQTLRTRLQDEQERSSKRHKMDESSRQTLKKQLDAFKDQHIQLLRSQNCTQ